MHQGTISALKMRRGFAHHRRELAKGVRVQAHRDEANRQVYCSAIAGVDLKRRAFGKPSPRAFRSFFHFRHS
jgi:hypothetical protein